MNIEDMIADQQMVISITHSGYVKRLPLATYRQQRRGGIGVMGMDMKEGDYIEHLHICSTHDFLLFFTNRGKVYRLKVYELPEGSRTSKGRALVNVLPLRDGERVMAVIPTRDFTEDKYLAFATAKGLVKKTEFTAYNTPIRADGIIAIKVRDGDELVQVRLTSGDDDLLLVSKSGHASRFNETAVRPMGRDTSGVKGMNVSGKFDGEPNRVLAMDVARDDAELFVVTENGYGKRTAVAEYPVKGRGTKGVLTIKMTAKKGGLAGALIVREHQDLLFISQNGMVQRTQRRRDLADGPRHAGRAGDEPQRGRPRQRRRPGGRVQRGRRRGGRGGRRGRGRGREARRQRRRATSTTEREPAALGRVWLERQPGAEARLGRTVGDAVGQTRVVRGRLGLLGAAERTPQLRERRQAEDRRDAELEDAVGDHGGAADRNRRAEQAEGQDQAAVGAADAAGERDEAAELADRVGEHEGAGRWRAAAERGERQRQRDHVEAHVADRSEGHRGAARAEQRDRVADAAGEVPRPDASASRIRPPPASRWLPVEERGAGGRSPPRASAAPTAGISATPRAASPGEHAERQPDAGDDRPR